MVNISHLVELDQLAREDGAKYHLKRFLFDEILAGLGKHFIGITGPRGAGKTILLKQIALNQEHAFYLSLDTFDGDLFQTIKTIKETLKVKIFLLDEVHMHLDFEGELKKVYDFLDVRVIFTSSMALAIHQSAHDLSRRVLLKTMYPFSLREYAYFKFGKSVKAITIDDILALRFDAEVLIPAAYFQEYIKGGLMPFSLHEPDPLSLLKNVVQTIIYKDIARCSALSMPQLDEIFKLLSFIGRSGIDGINYSSLSHNIGITKYRAEQYVTLLEKAFVLHQVFPQGNNVLREPKIVMALPFRLLYQTYEEAIGGLREDFFVEAVKVYGGNLQYLKSSRGEKTPDYVLEGRERIVFEIGGKGKGITQFKGHRADQKIILTDSLESGNIKRPLALFGFI